MNFRSNFWESDFASQNGFDTLAQHIKEGQKSCKWVEDYLRNRAKLEEEFSRKLIQISKQERSSNSDFGTMKTTIDQFRAQTELEATFHQNFGSKLLEESQRLTEFREKQRDERKKIEDKMHRTNKQKKDLHLRMVNCKENYQNKCKLADKAESDLEKIKFTNKPKEVEKSRKNAQQLRTNADKADEDYKTAVTNIETSRKQWISEHTESCDTFQNMEETRISQLRNVIWKFANFSSELACKLDDSDETIRKTTEKCDPKTDIRDFSSKKKVGINQLAPIVYTSCYPPPTTTPAVVAPQQPNGNEGDYSFATSDYAQVERRYDSTYESADVIMAAGRPASSEIFEAIYSYSPQNSDEIELQQGDRITKTQNVSNEEGWLKGTNMRTNKSGYFPCNYVR